MGRPALGEGALSFFASVSVESSDTLSSTVEDEPCGGVRDPAGHVAPRWTEPQAGAFWLDVGSLPHLLDSLQRFPLPSAGPPVREHPIRV